MTYESHVILFYYMYQQVQGKNVVGAASTLIDTLKNAIFGQKSVTIENYVEILLQRHRFGWKFHILMFRLSIWMKTPSKVPPKQTRVGRPNGSLVVTTTRCKGDDKETKTVLQHKPRPIRWNVTKLNSYFLAYFFCSTLWNIHFA